MSENIAKGGQRETCPHCGAVVPRSAAVCPNCGYEFSDLDANSYSILLANMLAEQEYDEDKCQVIENFALPKSKDDLLEFATSLKPRVMNIDSPLADSYMIKYQELIEKIKRFFPHDPQLKPYVDEFPALQASIEAKRKKIERQEWFEDHMKGLLIAACIIIALLVTGGLLFAFRDTAANNADRCVTAVTKAVDKDNLSKARNFVVGYKKDKDDVIEGYVTLLSKYLDEGMWNDAKSLVEFYGQGNYTQALNRGLYNYLLSTGEYNQAEQYINVEEAPSDNEYFQYMEDCVKLMCAAGLINPAEEFIARKAIHFVSNQSGSFTKANVQARLEQIVDAYK